jgi:hypothetical protein
LIGIAVSVLTGLCDRLNILSRLCIFTSLCTGRDAV